MIFGSKKQKQLTDQVVKAVSPNLRLVETMHGVPNGFWSDAYALGFMMGQINAQLSLHGGDGLGVADKGRILVDCFASLSGAKGKPISETAMVFAHEKEPEFMRANQNGMFIAMYEAEHIPNADKTVAVNDARQALAKEGTEATVATVAAHLLQVYWVEEMVERMRIGGRRAG